MSGILKNLFAMGISAGIADKDAFVEKVSGLIQEYQNDPEQAQKWAEALVNYLGEMKDNIRLQNNMEQAFKSTGIADGKNVEELTQAVKELTEQLRKQKG